MGTWPPSTMFSLDYTDVGPLVLVLITGNMDTNELAF